MDAVIRSALLAPTRTRLSHARAVPAVHGPAGTAGAPVDDAHAALARLRADIESQVRAEIAGHAEQLYARERERARTDGYAEGLAEAKIDTGNARDHERKQHQEQLARALSALERAHQAALSTVESSVGEIAFAAVSRLVNEKAASREFVLGLVEITCAELRADSVATARLHPRDIAALGDLSPDGSLRIQSLNLNVVADDSLALGGCVIDAGSGRYDGALESQLRRLHAVLTGAPAPDAQE
jgi:flagellar assembly protein FliH